MRVQRYNKKIEYARENEKNARNLEEKWRKNRKQARERAGRHLDMPVSNTGAIDKVPDGLETKRPLAG